VLTPERVLLSLKIAVLAVTVIFLGSQVALLRGNYRLHGRLNLAFSVLTLAALLGLELVTRVVAPELFTEYFDRTGSWTALYIHLGFAVPSALVLPCMLYTGLRGLRSVHLTLAGLFVIVWTGTVVTGVFFLPHAAVP
jgi:uncharacterized membrane protein YozB (DUF420 family)